MSTGDAALPRKIPADGPLKALTDSAKVERECVKIWEKGRKAGRGDTFIGIIKADTMILYVAPCFGVNEGDVPRGEIDKASHQKNISIGNFDRQTTVISSTSTSATEYEHTESTKSAIQKVYGQGNVCYVELDPVNGFDGKSHQSMFRWVSQKFDFAADWWHDALGFGIQRDRAGYYVRYASTLNELHGQMSGDRFGARSSARADREPRDLPKQWAQLIERVLARDLRLGMLDKGESNKFERMTARDEGKTTKLSRFVHLERAGSTTGKCILV